MASKVNAASQPKTATAQATPMASVRPSPWTRPAPHVTVRAAVTAAVRGRVRWTGFFPNQKEVSAVYHLSDVLVLPSDYEPWALVINEAAAAGLAVGLAFQAESGDARLART